MSLSEYILHREIVNFLVESLPPGAVFHHSPNCGRRSFAEAQALRSQGMKAGWPDLEIMYQGRAYFLEVKPPNGRLSDPQKQCHAFLRAAGCPVATCRSVPDAAEFLREQLPLRADLLI